MFAHATMTHSTPPHGTPSWAARWALILVPIAIGASLYLCFGVPTLRVFGWFDALGLGPLVDDLRGSGPVQLVWLRAPRLVGWTLHHVPDACWVYAWTVYFGAFAAHERFGAAWRWGGVLLAVGAECLQITGIVPGTFDPIDLAAYAGGFLGATLTLHRVPTTPVEESTR